MCNLFLPPEHFFVQIIDDPLTDTKAETESYSETAITPDSNTLYSKIYANRKLML